MLLWYCLLVFYLCVCVVCLSSLANVERSNLYLKLFKLVFGSVSLLANENEQMLKVTCFVIIFF